MTYIESDWCQYYFMGEGGTDTVTVFFFFNYYLRIVCTERSVPVNIDIAIFVLLLPLFYFIIISPDNFLCTFLYHLYFKTVQYK